jgi:hypothetical protein
MPTLEPPPAPYYSDATITLHHGDCLDALIVQRINRRRANARRRQYGPLYTVGGE